MQKLVLFQLKDAVFQVGDQICGTCYVRILEDIPKALVTLYLQCIEYSKILEKKQIPYDANNPQMIADSLIEKQQKVRISLDSPPTQLLQKSEDKKRYELINGNTLFRVIQQYGSAKNHSFEIQLYTGYLKKGDYKFPFQLPTNEDMHSSFQFRSEDGLKQAKIQYKLLLKVVLPQDDHVILKGSTQVFINSRFKESQQQRSSEGNIVQYLCLSRGAVSLDIHIDKNSYIPGEQLTIQYSLDTTRCQRGIERVEAQLINKLTFIDNDEVERIVGNQILLVQSLGSINAGQKVQNQKYVLTIPKALRATVKSPILRNQYFLEVHAIADAFLTWMSVPIMCRIPLQIQESQVPTKVSLEGWNIVPIMHLTANAFSNMSVQQSQAT